MRVYYGTSHELMLTGYSVDLSSRGLYIKTKVPLDIAATLILTFSLPGQPDEQNVSCKGRVAWVNDEKNPSKPELPPGMGIELTDLSSENLSSISTFLEIEAKW